MVTASLHDWLARQGARIGSMAVVEGGTAGRGVCATADIPSGEVVLCVPRAAMITRDVARRSPVGRRLFEADIDTPSGHGLLAAFLLAEKRRAGSPLAPYLEALPAEFPTVPLFFPKDALPVLRGSFAATLIVKRREALCRDLLALRKVVPALRDVSVREYFWARTVVISRVFGLGKGDASTEAFVPMADMLNHKRPPDIDWNYDDDRETFVLTAARDIRAGEELHDSYGRKPNARYFVHYGFAMPHGADDEVELYLGLPAGEPRSSTKISALRRLGGPEAWIRISNRVRNDDTQRAFTFLRAAAAGDAEAGRVASLIARREPIPPLSPRSESAALALLDKACAAALARFDTPDLAEDEALLAQADLPVNVRNALVVRRGEKRLLHAYRRLCAASIDLLRLPRKRFFEAAVHFSGEGLTASYLLETALSLAPREARAPTSLYR